MRARILAAALAVGPLVLCGCSGGGGGAHSGQVTAVDAAGLVSVSPAGKAVDPTVPIVVTADHGTLTDVTVRSADGRVVAGSIAGDDRSWRSSGPLSAGQRYTVRVSADNGHGGRGSTLRQFSTIAAPRTLSVTLAPGDKATYGVGEPVTATLSVPVHDEAARQAVERGLTVDSTPSVTGAWYWVNDTTLHFRPETFWPAHSTVSASFNMEGHPIGTGLYGGAPSQISFGVGDKLVSVTDAGSDQMTVTRNGQVVKTFPVTTGKPGFSTRNGTKVVLEQEPLVVMDSSTVGIAAGSSNAYHLDVRWATRVTWSGEYVHAAPWSEGSQGVSNVSHGCTGMSTEDARWFYDNFHRGDVVQVVNSLGHEMEPFGNGFGDWNLTWDAWRKGSALDRVVNTAPVAASGSVAATAGFIRPRA